MLMLGDTVYQLHVNNHAWDKKRLEMIDADGNTWFRYDRPDYTYTITENTVIGRVVHVSEWLGEPREPAQETTYFLDDDSEWYESDINRTDSMSTLLYTDTDLAYAAIQRHKELYP